LNEQFSTGTDDNTSTTSVNSQINQSINTQEPINLKLIQDKICQCLQVDITAIVQQAIAPALINIHASMAKLNTRYDKLLHTIQMIHQQYQQQFQQYEKVLPSLAKCRDGHA